MSPPPLLRCGVVLPTYQEAESIGPMVKAIHQVLPHATVLVVDDASPDGTARIAEEHGAVVLRRNGPRGLGPAYREGFCRALSMGLDPIFQMDADFSHHPEDLPRLWTGADLCLGSRYIEGGGTENWELYRRLLSRGGSLYARLALSLPYRDLTGGFKCWRAHALRQIRPGMLRCDGYAFQIETTWRASCCGLKIQEVPILFSERQGGSSKMSLEIALEAIWRVPALRWDHDFLIG